MTKEQLLDLEPCSEGLKFAKECKFDFHKIYETCPRGDWLLWLLRKTGQITKPQAVQIAVACAEHVLPIYEKKNPADKRPRLAIEAARAWLTSPSESNHKAAYAAADAADAAANAAAYAADAADAAYAAADAADAAANAAAYAADAADAAYAAAAYAAYAADAADAAYAAAAYAANAADAAANAAYAAADAADARKEERLWQANTIRAFIPNPFEK